MLLSGTAVAEIVASSGGQLPPIQQLLYVTVGGTHLNFWLRALSKNCTTNEKAIATPSGRLDTATLFAHQPDLRDAVNDGLARVTLDSSLLAVEGLAEYIQKALNQTATEAVSEVELITRCCCTPRFTRREVFGMTSWSAKLCEIFRLGVFPM